MNMNPTAPNLHATMKLHKQNTSIRPILNNYLHLPYTYNVQNPIHLMTDLQVIELNKDMRLCSFDIENMFTNIPKIGIINTINTILENLGTETNIQKEIIHILRTMIEQNYFQFDQEYYKQHIEHTQIYPILTKKQIIA
jgi:hypothetical protein